jgi:putative membrane protein
LDHLERGDEVALQLDHEPRQVALTIDDGRQGRGLGTLLLHPALPDLALVDHSDEPTPGERRLCRMSARDVYDPAERDRRRSPGLSTRLAASWLTNALVLGVVAAALHDVRVHNTGSLIAAAAVFGVLNTVLKPVLRVVTLPLAVLSLGIAWFFVSLLMLLLTGALVSGFHIRGFWTLIGATLIVWLVNLVLDHTPGPWQITGKRRRRRR